jgi:hypothetical protein
MKMMNLYGRPSVGAPIPKLEPHEPGAPTQGPPYRFINLNLT